MKKGRMNWMHILFTQDIPIWNTICCQCGPMCKSPNKKGFTRRVINLPYLHPGKRTFPTYEGVQGMQSCFTWRSSYGSRCIYLFGHISCCTNLVAFDVARRSHKSVFYLGLELRGRERGRGFNRLMPKVVSLWIGVRLHLQLTVLAN